MERNWVDRIGNYRIEHEIGTSGAGLLLQAQHVVVPRRAIIKIIQPRFETNQGLVVEMLREACILEALAHPGVPIIYETGLLHGRQPWFAFEANTGPTLDALLAAGELPMVDVVALVSDLADILEHAHRRGVLHAGLQPSGVVLTPGRRYPLYIPDWRTAILSDAVGDVPRQVSEAARSYVAPELLRPSPGNTIDGRVDVFSLGVIAHRALTGRLPFAPGLGTEPYPPSHERRPDAPRELTTLIDSMLAFEPRERPSASDVRGRIGGVFAIAPEWELPAAATDEAPASAMPLVSSEELVALSRRQHLRRPRWTPQVRYEEAIGLGDDTIIDDDVADDFME